MRFPLSVLAIAMLSTTPVFAKHWHDDEKHHGKHARVEERCYLEERDVRIVREYYEPRYRALPPGLAKKYARTGQLPPGWKRKLEPLPVAVERRLVVLPPEYRRGYVDGSVVVYSPRTHAVIDIVALFGR